MSAAPARVSCTSSRPQTGSKVAGRHVDVNETLIAAESRSRWVRYAVENPRGDIPPAPGCESGTLLFLLHYCGAIHGFRHVLLQADADHDLLEPRVFSQGC